MGIQGVPVHMKGVVPWLVRWARRAGTRRDLCPFAVYYLRYAVRPLFTMSRISLADGKRAGQKVQRKIAAAVQKVKTPLLFIPLF